MNKLILVINSGSSSIKFSLFSINNEQLVLFYNGNIRDLFESPQISILDVNQTEILNQSIGSQGHEAGLKALFNWLEGLSHSIVLAAVGHRVVHGGTFFLHPTLITDATIKKMETLIPLAPLHQPHNLEAVNIIKRLYPGLIQVACFDTTFHQTQEKLATLFALPRSFSEEGILRYGFHGLSYEYIASVITHHIGAIGTKRVLIAHLGNGASMCAMHNQRSIATSMGFTALDGLMMGTRCGRIDPGVLLYLLEEKNYTPKRVEYLLYNESGLLGVSEFSNNVRELLEHLDDEKVMEAVNLFCYRAALEAGSLLVALGGIDALIFTAGIGEHAPLIRTKISNYLSWLGMRIDEQANQDNATIISTKDSTILVGVIPTNEEYIIAKHVHLLMKN